MVLPHWAISNTQPTSLFGNCCRVTRQRVFKKQTGSLENEFIFIINSLGLDQTYSIVYSIVCFEDLLSHKNTSPITI